GYPVSVRGIALGYDVEVLKDKDSKTIEEAARVALDGAIEDALGNLIAAQASCDSSNCPACTSEHCGNELHSCRSYAADVHVVAGFPLDVKCRVDNSNPSTVLCIGRSVVTGTGTPACGNCTCHLPPSYQCDLQNEDVENHH